VDLEGSQVSDSGSQQTLGKSSYKELVFKRPPAPSKEASKEPIDIEDLYNLAGLDSKSSVKFADRPVSSDGMVMRTSFKVRFEVSRKKLFGGEPQRQLNTQKLKLQDKQESQIKRALQR
jgi:hypothetical protein